MQPHVLAMRLQRIGRLVQLIGASLGISFAAAATHAQTSETYVTATEASSPTEQLLKDRFVINVGLFVVGSKTNGSLRGTANTTDQPINFDQAFGLDADTTRWRIDGLWRITPKHRLRFFYFNDDVSRTRTFNQNLEWGDYTFEANGAVTARLKRSVYVLDYEYAFLRRPNYEVAVSGGIHFDDIKLSLAGNAAVTANGVQQPATFTSKTSAIPAPMPVLGIRGDWALSPHWYLEGSLQGFKISYQAFDGNWTDLRAGVTYMFNHHFGLGVGFERWATHTNISKADFNGRLNFGYQGGLIYFKGGF
jgi:hypothetical protein